MLPSQSDFKVEVVAIDSIIPHPGADRLSLACVKGWQCIVQKDKYKAGDLAVYIPIDSILPKELETILFGPDAKIKLSGSRVKTLKLRGAISQGMLADQLTLGLLHHLEIGADVTQILGITKFEPPVPQFQQTTVTAPFNRKNSYFKEYTKHHNLKNIPTLFNPEDLVTISEKIHGTNFRAGWVPSITNTLWRKLLKLVKLLPEWQFVYGSHRVQISEKMLYTGFYEKNVYAEAVVKYKLKEIIPKGYVIYGEVYGSGIQKGYTYECIEGEHKLAVFDIRKNADYINQNEFDRLTNSLNLPVVPKLYEGLFKNAPLDKLIKGNSVLASTQKIREGVVVKTKAEPRKTAKVISPDYLLGDQTDFH